jgi:hypothetical protein
MKHPWIFLLALLFAGVAHAQYRWVDKDGKTRYGDTPPPGIKASRIGAPASGSAPAQAPQAAASKDGGKDANKGPMTSAEKEQDFRKRQELAKKDADKAEQERQDKATKSSECAGLRESLQALESGQRIPRTSPTGERYYMDEGQVAQEAAKTRQTLKQFCS